MPSKRDNEEERFARIAALMEEYRVKHEDLEAYLKTVRHRMDTARRQSRVGITAARGRFKRTRHR